MKRLLILALAIMSLLIVLSVSVGAEVVISSNNIEDETGDIVADLLVDLGNNYHMTSVDISYTNTEGQKTNGKLYYETSYYTQKNQRQLKTVYIPKDFDMSQIIYFLDKVDINGNGSYESTELIKLYQGGGGFKMYTYKSYENGEFTETADAIPYIEIVSYSKYFYLFADKGFGSKAPKLTTITYNGREPVANTFIVSPLINEIFSGSFGGDGTSLTSNSIVTPFKKLIFEDREGTVTLGQYCFTRCIIEEIYFGKGTYKLHDNSRIALLFEKNYANGEAATLNTVILHKDAIISTGSISWNVGSYDVIVLGKESESKAFYEANNQSRLTCAKSVAYNPCYYGHTTEDDFNCETALVCSACDQTLVEASSHDALTTISYPNGYSQDGIKIVKCQKDGCNYDAQLVASPLFETKGYSTPENGRGDIVISFMINYDEIAEYEKSASTSLKYGVFAIAYDKIGESDIMTNDNTICVEVENYKYISFEMRISGFETNTQKNAKLSIGAYVTDSNGESSYLQAAEPKDGESFHYITYNEIYKEASTQ